MIFSGTNKQKGNQVIEDINATYKGKRCVLLHVLLLSMLLLSINLTYWKNRPHNAVFFCADVTDWRAQEEIYLVAESTFGKTIDIVIMVAGILDSSSLINDHEQGTLYNCHLNILLQQNTN